MFPSSKGYYVTPVIVAEENLKYSSDLTLQVSQRIPSQGELIVLLFKARSFSHWFAMQSETKLKEKLDLEEKLEDEMDDLLAHYNFVYWITVIGHRWNFGCKEFDDDDIIPRKESKKSETEEWKSLIDWQKNTHGEESLENLNNLVKLVEDLDKGMDSIVIAQ